MTCEYEEVRITPPKDPSILERLGYAEEEISYLDGDGNVQTITVLTKAVEAPIVCSAVVCNATLVCG